MEDFSPNMVKQYSCDLCSNSFSSTSNLRKHTKIHSGKDLFSCAECNKSFNRAGNLKIHMLIHTGERPHRCNLCDYASNQSQNLSTHMMAHSGVKLHNCEQCSKSLRKLSKSKKQHKCTQCNYSAISHYSKTKARLAQLYFNLTKNLQLKPRLPFSLWGSLLL